VHNEELHNWYSSQNIIRVIKWRIIQWMEDVARMGDTRSAYTVSVGEPDGKTSFGKPGIDGRRVILKWIPKKQGVRL
jgi:hypothetical protein